mgnify:CR=1 FL=1
MDERTRIDLDAFVATEYAKVVSAVAMIAGNRDDAADSVQDALVGFIANPPAREIRNIAAWITVVAANRARDRHRSRASESRALGRVGVMDEAAVPVIDTLDIDVQAALRSLPDRQREVCVMHYLLDLSVEQVAEGPGVTEGTVKTQLFRARKALSASLSATRGGGAHD